MVCYSLHVIKVCLSVYSIDFHMLSQDTRKLKTTAFTFSIKKLSGSMLDSQLERVVVLSFLDRDLLFLSLVSRAFST